MPQWYGPNGEENQRSSSDEALFGLMLGAIADLYLTAKVLILLDGSYGSRFWVRAAAAIDTSLVLLYVRCPTSASRACVPAPARARRR